MTRVLTALVTLPCGDFDEDVPHEATGYVTLRGDTYDVNIKEVLNLASGTIERGAGLSGRHAMLVEEALCDAYERRERAQKFAQSVADEVRSIVAPFAAGGGR